MAYTAINNYLNRILEDPESKLFWTVQKELKRRKTPYSMWRANDIQETVGEWPYRRTVKRQHKAFEQFEAELSEDGVMSRIEQWKLRIVPVFNGYPEAYQALCDEAMRRGLPQNYRNDLLVHDRNELCSPGWTSREFLWVLRTSGTQLFSLDPNKINLSNGNRPVQLVKAMGRFGDPEVLWYVFRGGNLSEITYDKALEIAAEAERRAA